MAAGRVIIEGYMPALDTSAKPLSGAKIYFYLNGTTTLTTVYADEDLTTPLTNPVVANSAGQFASIFADASLQFSVKVENSAGGLLVARDGVRAIGPGNGGATLDLATVAAAEAADLSGQAFVRTAGFAAAGDSGAALYRPAEEEPAHAGKFQSEDGAWWELSEVTITPEMIADTGGASPAAALQSAIDYSVEESRPLLVPSQISSATGLALDLSTTGADQPFRMTGVGWNINDPTAGSYFTNTGSDPALTITTAAGYQNSWATIEDFAFIGDSPDAANADGVRGNDASGLVHLNRLLIKDHGGWGASIDLGFSSKVTDNVIFGNYSGGILYTGAANRVDLSNNLLYANGRDVAAPGYGIRVNCTGNPAYGMRIYNNDVSYCGREIASRAAGTLTNIVVAAGTATATIPGGHGLVTGNIGSIVGTTVDLNNQTKAMYTTFTAPTPTTLTWPCAAPDGTYADASMAIKTYAIGLLTNGVKGGVNDLTFCEVTPGWGYYGGSENEGMSHRGGFYLSNYMAIEQGRNQSVSSICFFGPTAGLFTREENGRPTIDVGYDNAFLDGAIWDKGTNFRAGGQAFDAAQPTTGTWQWVGENVLSTSLTKGGISGWRRLTTGTGAVAGTDWTPIRDTYIDLSFDYDQPSIAAGSTVILEPAMSGVALGDFVQISINTDLLGLTVTAYVQAAGQVRIVMHNSTGSAIDIGNATYRLRVQKA